MQKYAILFLLLIGLGDIYSTEMPDEVREILQRYKSDTTGSAFSFNYAKKIFQLPDSLSIDDIEIGIPLECYRIECHVLDSVENISISKFMRKLNYWRVPIMVSGVSIYLLTIKLKGNHWKFAGMGELRRDNVYDKLYSVYKDSSNLPVYVGICDRGFFYFQKNEKKNLFYHATGYPDDSLSMIASSSFHSLDESEIILKYH